MEQNTRTERISLEQQIASQEELCRRAKDQLELAQSKALQRQFEVTKLNTPGFFRRHFCNLRKQKKKAWDACQEACLVLEQAKLDLAEQNECLAKLKTAYQTILAEE